MKELIIALLFAILFYIIMENRNLLTLKQSDEKMANVDYQTDNINDIRM
jgi:YbbR domain-containing protein